MYEQLAACEIRWVPMDIRTARVTSLEGASGHSVQPGCYAAVAAQHLSPPTAVVRGGPSGTDATGTQRARPARTTLAPAGQQRSPARPEGEARPG
jgi:hypothetical protein